MATNRLESQTIADERIYLRARTVLCVLLAALPFLGLTFPGGHEELGMYYFLLILVAATTAAVFVAAKSGAEAAIRAMMWVLIVDLISFAGFTYLFHDMSDGFYPVMVILPVAYALVVGRKEATLVGFGVAASYSVGFVISHRFTPAEFVLFALKAAAIVFVAGMVALSVERQRRREAETLAAVEESAHLNERMERRIGELQAVSQITEMIHSSLDFERIGHSVLEILGKVIGIDTCCLFVIDKEKSETLFSASIGSVAGVSPYTVSGAAISPGDEHFSCLSVFDHLDTMVMFCAHAEDLERITEEDRIVLGAVASELVVAVENSRLYRLTKKLAVTDELTGLYNYRHLQNKLDEEIERSRRYGKRLSLLMIDADDFKRFNDTQGHLAGDAALNLLGTTLRVAVREVDLVARYGGEEFSIVLPETDAAGAFVVAEKVREAVASQMFVDSDGALTCHLTVSIGVATYPTHAWDKESLLREADDALYRAKNGGKNRVRTPLNAVDRPPTDNREDHDTRGSENADATGESR